MLLGYLILRALTVLVRLFGRLPDGVSRTFARLLNSATTPFDAVNYLGSRLGGMFDHVIAKLTRILPWACITPRGGTRSSPTTCPSLTCIASRHSISTFTAGN